MQLIRTEIPDVFILEPKVFGDERGFFMESYSRRRFSEATGLDIEFVQDNESLSSSGVLRGLHFQVPPMAQAKLVRVSRGRVLDVAVDLRRNSGSYGKHVIVELSAENKRQMFIGNSPTCILYRYFQKVHALSFFQY